MDISEWTKYRDALGKMQTEYPEFVRGCVKELAESLLAKTVSRTPSDQEDVRKGWSIGSIRQTAGKYEVEIFNEAAEAANVEYGHHAQDGSGWVQGRFMLTLSAEELERSMPVILERKLRDFMKNQLE